MRRSPPRFHVLSTALLLPPAELAPCDSLIPAPEVQCWGGTHHPNASGSPADCRESCCRTSGCVWWGLAGPQAVAKVKGCWVSVAPSHCESSRIGWTGEYNQSMPPPPRPPPAVPVNLSRAVLAHRFDGIGAIIDASSRFLYDYPEPQRSEVLDYLFLPGFGASLSICKVEVGGDAQQTDGTTASYLHDPAGEPNFDRTHIWWAMGEATARRPGILLYGLAWGFPGWVGGGDFYSEGPGVYLAGWAKGAQERHGLTVSVLGLWNERMPCKLDHPLNDSSWNCSMIFGLRRALDRQGLGSVRIAGHDSKVDTLPMLYQTGAPVDIIATHGYTPLPVAEQEADAARGRPRWRSESEDTYKSSARMAAHLVQDYLNANVTAVIEWPATQGYYPSFPWAANDMFSYANSPWSGHYRIPSPVWVFAHMGQFTAPGWKYLRMQSHDGGGRLAGGGNFVALVSPDRANLTVLIESTMANLTENITFLLPPRYFASPAGIAPALEQWHSNLTTNNPDSYFLQLPDLPVDPVTGSVTVSVPAASLITLSSMRGQARKGQHPAPPADAAFPLPYRVNYSEVTQRWRQARFQLDQQGSFEIDDVAVQGGAGPLTRGLLQTVREVPIQWVWATPRPLSILGDAAWDDISVTATGVMLEQSATLETTIFDCSMAKRHTVPGTATKLPAPVGGTFLSVGVRTMVAGNICGAGRNDTRGYFLLVHSNKTYTITKGSQQILDAGPIQVDGLSVLQNFLREELQLSISAKGDAITAAVNGQHLSTVHDADFAQGFASIATGWHQVLFKLIAIDHA
eukprot:gene8462-1513_t